MNPESREQFAAENAQAHEKMRASYEASRNARPLIDLKDARTFAVPYGPGTPEVPEFVGVRVIDDIAIDEIIPYIDWSPFFHAWEIRGTADLLLGGADVDPRVTELKRDADLMLQRIAAEKLFTAKAVYGFFPAGRDGDDVVVFDEDRAEVARFHMLRRQESPHSGKTGPGSCPCLADYVKPVQDGAGDHIGAFVVTTGLGVDEVAAIYEKDHDDYGSIMAKLLADRLAEAFTELLHERMRREWGYGNQEDLSQRDLIDAKYRGIRPAPGYPACPDHTEKGTLFALLGATDRIGVSLTESFAMLPAASVSGLVFGHPDSRYFSVSRIGRDQIADYARRKKEEVSVVERWLAPNLAYDPD